MARDWVCARCAAENDEAAVSCRTCGFIRGGQVASLGPAPAPPPAVGAPPPAPGSWSGTQAPQRSDWTPGPASNQSGWTPGSAPAPGGWPGAQPSLQPAGAKRQLATGLLANVGVRIGVILLIVAVGGGIAWFTSASRDANGQIDKAGDLMPADLKVGDCFDLPGSGSSFDPSATIDKTTAMPCAQAHHYEVFYTGTLDDTGSYPTDTQLNDFTDANCTPAFAAYVGVPVESSAFTYYFFFPDSSSWDAGDRGIQCSLADPDLAPLAGSARGSNR
jgi:hypothetical protein